MPELPEVENLRRALARRIIGRRVVECSIHRTDVCESAGPAGITPDSLLREGVICETKRRGKQFAIVDERGRVLCFGLGMTGALEIHESGTSIQPHTHVQWFFDDGSRMDFIDPRRFGGVYAFVDCAQLFEARWSRLGPDALEADAASVFAVARHSRRSIKSVLLDQAVIAGVGNIYADESLFRSGIDPRKLATRIDLSTWGTIVENVKAVLRSAIEDGGSTIRDYRMPDGSRGRAQERHAVYGRAGEPCVKCAAQLRSGAVAQRTTVWCPSCQRR